MKWKSEVTVSHDNGCHLLNEKIIIFVDPKDEYIVWAMEYGMTEETAFIQLVMQTEHTNEIDAGFRMAEFVEKYGAYLSESKEHQIIPV